MAEKIIEGGDQSDKKPSGKSGSNGGSSQASKKSNGGSAPASLKEPGDMTIDPSNQQSNGLPEEADLEARLTQVIPHTRPPSPKFYPYRQPR